MGTVADDKAVPNGCRLVDLRTQPRETPEEAQAWLTNWLQGVQEGTIIADKEQVKAAELDMKARGLLITKTERTVKSLSIEGPLAEMLEAFGASNRLRVNTTATIKKAGRD